MSLISDPSCIMTCTSNLRWCVLTHRHVHPSQRTAHETASTGHSQHCRHGYRQRLSSGILSGPPFSLRQVSTIRLKQLQQQSMLEPVPLRVSSIHDVWMPSLLAFTVWHVMLTWPHGSDPAAARPAPEGSDSRIWS